jgi:uncharacterized membrane protein
MYAALRWTALGALCAAGLAACAPPPPAPAPAPSSPLPAFEARGQEPGWLAQLSPAGLSLTLDYGERRLTTPPPAATSTAGGTVYASVSAAGPVRMTVLDRPCADAMSGQPYPATVTLVVADRTYEGCGGPPIASLR